MCLVCLPETTHQQGDRVPGMPSRRGQLGPWSLPPKVEPCPAPSSPSSRPPCLLLSMPPAPLPTSAAPALLTGATPQCWQRFAATWPPCGEAPEGGVRVCPCCIPGYCSLQSLAKNRHLREICQKKTQNLLTKSTPLKEQFSARSPSLAPSHFVSPGTGRQPEAPQMVPGMGLRQKGGGGAGSSFWARPKAGTSGNKRRSCCCEGQADAGRNPSRVPAIWGHRGQRRRSRLAVSKARGGWGLASRPGSSPWPCSRQKATRPQLVRESAAYFRGSGGPEDTSRGGRLGARARQHFL